MKEGSAKKIKLWPIPKPSPTNNPPSTGPIIPPSRPIPIAQPTPVERKAVGYMRAATAYNPTKLPCTPKPRKNNTTKIKFEPENRPKIPSKTAVIKSKVPIDFFNPNRLEKYPCTGIPTMAPRLKIVPE